MKRIIIAAIATTSIQANAQFNIGIFQDGHNAANAARYMPTYLGDKFDKVQITLANPYVSIGSNFTTVRNTIDFFTADNITSEMIGKSISRLKKRENNMNGVVDVAILNVAFNIPNKDGRKGWSLGFGVNERVEVNTSFNKETLLLAYSGNKQFADKTITLDPRFNGLAFTDYYVSAAYNIRPRYSDLVIKPAIRISYLSGQASVNMPKNNSISLYTQPDGRYLDFGLNYTINTSTSSDSVTLDGSSFNVERKSFEPGAGNGYGMDLGVRISPKPGLLFNIGVMDIGSIRFKKNVTNMYNYSNYRYEGEEITFNQGQSIDLDSLSGIAKPNYSHNGYTVNLPTRFIFSGSIGLGKAEAKGGLWYKHQLCLTYLQGFENYLSATKAPYVALGYTRSFNNVLNLGVNAGVGGVSGSSIGVLASVKVGFFSIGFSTSNIIPLIDASTAKSVDGAMMMVMSF